MSSEFIEGIMRSLRIRAKIPGGGTGKNSGYVLGRTASGEGPPHLIPIKDLLRHATSGGASVQALLDGITSTRGSLIERGSAGWVGLPPSAANKILADNGAGADPSWKTISALLDAVFSNAQGSILYRDSALWAALAPGTAGQVLNTGGAAANPSWSSVGAIAAPPVFTFDPQGATSNGQATSARGNILTCHSSISVMAVGALMVGISTGTYKIGIAPYNTGTNQITSAPTYTNTFTSAGLSPEAMAFKFASPFAMTAGNTYAVFIVRTDATSTTVLTTISNVTTTAFYSPGLYALGTGVKIRLASLAPLTSDTWTQAENGQHNITLSYALA